MSLPSTTAVRGVNIGLPAAGQGRRSRRPEPARYRWMDQWLIAKGAPLVDLVERTVSFLNHHESCVAPRRRARRPKDQLSYRLLVENLVANLAYAVLMPPEGGRLAVSLGHRRRTAQDNSDLSRQLSEVINLLASADLLEVYAPATVRREASSVRPSDGFARQVLRAGVDLSHFGRHSNEPLILLRRRGDDDTLIEFDETAETSQLAARVRRINVFLASASIDFLDDGELPRVDPYNRHLRRYFKIAADQEKPTFDGGGRLFGGFWQTVKSSRRANIRMSGEPVVALDYSSMFTRLAYAHLGAVPPEGDLYAIPGAEGYRSGIKLAMNCFLFDLSSSRRSWPDAMGVGVGADKETLRDNRDDTSVEITGRLPEGWTVGKTKRAILTRHPRLREIWGRGIGHGLMFKESEILLDVLDRLIREGIVGLPLHDAVLVRRSDVCEAKDIMEKAAGLRGGGYLPVMAKH